MNNIINDSSIWDLHIHSCKSPKSSGEFQNMSVNEFINKILEIFSDYPDLSLISFTDHNYFSYDVYKEFILKQSDIAVVPGIEIDVNIQGIKEAKHLIFYFNIEFDELESFAKKINSLLQNKKSIDINTLLEFFITEKIEFLISPHAFKQGKRAIEFDWNDEETTKGNMHKFMDQFFCFWETSGYSEIAKAIEFLKYFEKEECISIISFSDSSDEQKLRNYLSNPPQFFKSLPNFKGIQLAGTDSKRILKHPKRIDENNSGNIIGFVNINGKEIQLSDQLNVIVGGRGSGKSLLLDNIALNMDNSIREKDKLKKERIDFLDKFPIEVNNLDHTNIALDSKKIDYYDQSYVSKIFNSDNTNKEIETYFKDEFNALGELNSETKLQEIRLLFNSYLNRKNTTKPNDNISNFIGKYKIINENAVCLKFKKTDVKDRKIIDFNLEEALKYVNKSSKLIPRELKDNIDIKKALLDFLRVINFEVTKYNTDIEEHNFENIIKRKCISYLENKNTSVREKNEQEELFINHFKFECSKYEERTNIINALIKMQSIHQKEDELSDIKQGVDGSKFKFEKKLIYEEPLEYFKKMCIKYLGTKVKSYSLENLYNIFIFHLEDELKTSKNVDDFIKDLKSLNDYKIEYQCNILYGETEDSLKLINRMSPGTQTNILMEYIVSKDTKIPLLIDQPEDNIDNETIYTKLTSWFRRLKLKRQVIVVTHDANIVVNADAENVIIASKKSDDQFIYDYGALEYENILNRISIILDGGVEAVERRLKKYGREDNQRGNK